jgi:hypothetical protein
MYQAADKHRAEWPPGVQVKAVLPLAPVYFNVDEDDNSDGLVTRIPIAVLVGTCDEVATQYARSYVDDARGRNATGSYVFTVHGANHNFFNTQWSPASGQVGALDDVRPEPGVPASECRIGTDATPDRRLTEDQQRKVAAAYVPAFFDRHLKGETGNDPVLTGAELPVADVARVDIDAVPPV